MKQEERLERLNKMSDFLFGSQETGMPTLEERDNDLAMMQAELCENLYLLTGEKAGMAVVQDINNFLNYAKLAYLEAGFRAGALLIKKRDDEVDELFKSTGSALLDGTYRR